MATRRVTVDIKCGDHGCESCNWLGRNKSPISPWYCNLFRCSLNEALSEGDCVPQRCQPCLEREEGRLD